MTDTGAGGGSVMSNNIQLRLPTPTEAFLSNTSFNLCGPAVSRIPVTVMVEYPCHQKSPVYVFMVPVTLTPSTSRCSSPCPVA